MKLPLYVNAYDVKDNCFYKKQLVKNERGFNLLDYDGPTTPALYISPGWIDIHTHIYDGFSYLGIPADSTAGIKKGVHIAADAGTAGASTLAGLVKYILPANSTKIKVWLHINTTGILHAAEGSHTDLMNVPETVEAACSHRGLVCGIKVRIAPPAVLDKGIEPLRLAREASIKSGLPLMVHIGQAPPLIDEVLEYMDKGDVISHVFHGGENCPWNPDGSPSEALRRALERGTIPDIAHGLTAFDFDVYKKAIANKLPLHTISTDLHTRSINGPVHDLPTTMTKALGCGLELNEVIKSVTYTAAGAINETDWCGGYANDLKHATIFELTENADGRKLYDSVGAFIIPENMITPRAVIFKGDILDL